MTEREELKSRLIKAAKLAEGRGLCLPMSGNFSLRAEGGEIILITPSGLGRGGLGLNDIITVGPQGDIIENINNRKPSTELMAHIALYNARKDIGAVAHTHSPYATAFAVRGMKLKLMEIGLVPHEKPGSAELAKRAAESMKGVDACLLEGHGVLTVADTIENALLNAIYVEETAKIEAISKGL
jgi:L-fuculose-phosphate aldolase